MCGSALNMTLSPSVEYCHVHTGGTVVCVATSAQALELLLRLAKEAVPAVQPLRLLLEGEDLAAQWPVPLRQLAFPLSRRPAGETVLSCQGGQSTAARQRMYTARASRSPTPSSCTLSFPSPGCLPSAAHPPAPQHPADTLGGM
eukprot:scaffold23640_cov132-Isochrysis_galbana.AAC.1